MSVLAIFTGNITKVQYEALRQHVNWENQQPNGGIFHCASFDESDSIHVADVWESIETMNDFVENRLVPAMQELKIAPPDVTIYPTYNINAYQAIEKYKV